jgi:hypothetical protein
MNDIWVCDDTFYSFINSSIGIMDHLTTSSHRKDKKGKIVKVIELSVMNGWIGTDSLTCSLHKSQIKKMCDCKLVLSFFGGHGWTKMK